MPDKVFISYSHKDSEWLDVIRTYIAPKGIDGPDLWDDHRIQPGDNWSDDIANAIDAAGFCLLLVSQDFLNSEFVWKHELPKLSENLARADRIFWIKVRPTTWEGTSLAGFDCLSGKEEKALSELPKSKRETLLVEVAKSLKRKLQPKLGDKEGGQLMNADTAAPSPAPKAQAARQPLAVEWLHAFVDRKPQESTFLDIGKRISFRPGSNIALLPSKIDDRAELFIKRVTLLSQFSAQDLQWQPKRLDWPCADGAQLQGAEDVEDAFGSYISRVLPGGWDGVSAIDSDAVRQQFAVAIAKQTPIFWSAIQITTPNEWDKKLLERCLRWWIKVPLSKDVYPLVLFFITHNAGANLQSKLIPTPATRLWNFLAQDTGWSQGCLDGFAEEERPILLDPLYPVIGADLSDWLARIDDNRWADISDVRSDITDFIDDNNGQRWPMNDVEKLFTTAWKQKIKPAAQGS